MQKARYVAALGIPLVALLSFTLVAAWTDPTEAPPNGNVAAPINVGSTAQVKNGGLGVNTLTVFGNSLFGGSTGSNAYLNFGAAGGTDGYGIRDNDGTLEFKNSGGSWASLQSTIFNLVGGAGSWGASGNDIYNTNSGKVGIGTASPGQKLSVAGMVESTSGGVKFPDGTVQTTAMTHSFGGMYSTQVLATTGCGGAGSMGVAGNPFTGWYSCPAGYSTSLAMQIDSASGIRTCLWQCYK